MEKTITCAQLVVEGWLTLTLMCLDANITNICGVVHELPYFLDRHFFHCFSLILIKDIL